MVRLLSFALYLLSECLFLLGAGRECEGKHHREREESLLRRLSPLSLRFSPSRSLSPYPLLSMCAPLSVRVFLGCSCLERFRRARPPAYAPDVFCFHHSLFILHHSLSNHALWLAMVLYLVMRGILQSFWYRQRISPGTDGLQ